MKRDYRAVKDGIEELRKQLPYGSSAAQKVMEVNCKLEAYQEVLDLLDILENEPPGRFDWKVLGKAVLIVLGLGVVVYALAYMTTYCPALMLCLMAVWAVILVYRAMKN